MKDELYIWCKYRAKEKTISSSAVVAFTSYHNFGIWLTSHFKEIDILDIWEE